MSPRELRRQRYEMQVRLGRLEAAIPHAPNPQEKQRLENCAAQTRQAIAHVTETICQNLPSEEESYRAQLADLRRSFEDLKRRVAALEQKNPD